MAWHGMCGAGKCGVKKNVLGLGGFETVSLFLSYWKSSRDRIESGEPKRRSCDASFLPVPHPYVCGGAGTWCGWAERDT